MNPPASRSAAIARAVRHFDAGDLIADLARRVAVRTESQLPEGAPFLREYLAGEIAPAFERMGFGCETFANPVTGAGPLLVASRIEDERLPTVLLYGHGVVIRGLSGQWSNDASPWELRRDGDRYYGAARPNHNLERARSQIAVLEALIKRREDPKAAFQGGFFLGISVVAANTAKQFSRGTPWTPAFAVATASLWPA